VSHSSRRGASGAVLLYPPSPNWNHHLPPFIGPFTSPNQAREFTGVGEPYRSIYNPQTQLTLRTRPFGYRSITADMVRASIEHAP
jgi:hypothetical protein